MFAPGLGSDVQKTTSYKVVLPFYIYASIAFLLACSLLLINTGIVYEHHFQPQTLAITHLMALGWGTMIILGASHQLLPVLIEGKLDSNLLAYLSFIFAAIGIPLLVIGFYRFDMGLIVQSGAVLINVSVICYFINVIQSIGESKKYNVHAWFMATAALWLFATTFFGLMLVFNFTHSWLPENSIQYLSLHAHLGIVGWFFMLVLGVASRLIPMFLISKYTSPKTLWWIYGLVNVALLYFVVLKTTAMPDQFQYLPALMILVALISFGRYCYNAYKARIRKKVDGQMKISLISVGLMFLPIFTLFVVIFFTSAGVGSNIILLYGFCIFFGWITALIFGMTFKTLPFIVWNKVYQERTGMGKVPVPKELFSEQLFKFMALSYLAGFFLFLSGIIFLSNLLVKSGAVFLLLAAIFYSWNVFKTINHQAVK